MPENVLENVPLDDPMYLRDLANTAWKFYYEARGDGAPLALAYSELARTARNLQHELYAKHYRPPDDRFKI